MIPNTHEVPLKTWRRLSDVARYVFNDTYMLMRDNQKLFLHPHTPSMPKAQWITIAWNAAWIAANGVMAAKCDVPEKKAA